MKPPIEITVKAANRLFELFTKSKEKYEGFLLSAKSGGCVGYKYDLCLIKEINSTNEVVSCVDACNQEINLNQDIKISIDNVSLFKCIGIKIDYTEENFSKRFIFSNKNSQSNCGCGESFSFENFFSAFNIKESFNIDLKQLDINYLELQSKYHPDSPNGNLEYSMYLNNAYQILKSDIKRAEYILEIKRFTLEKEDSEFLASIFQLLEKYQGKELCSILEEQINDSIAVMSSSFDNHDYRLAAKYLTRIKYLRRIVSQNSNG